MPITRMFSNDSRIGGVGYTFGCTPLTSASRIRGLLFSVGRGLLFSVGRGPLFSVGRGPLHSVGRGPLHSVGRGPLHSVGRGSVTTVVATRETPSACSRFDSGPSKSSGLVKSAHGLSAR